MKRIILFCVSVFVVCGFNAQIITFDTVTYAPGLITSKNDSTFSNKSKLKAHLLFNTEIKGRRIRLMENFPKPMVPVHKNYVAFWFWPMSGTADMWLTIDSNGATMNKKQKILKGDTLKTFTHTHAPYGVVVNDTDWVPKYMVDTTFYNFDVGKTTVITYQDGCADTGRNDVIIETPSGTMKFKHTFNVMLFEKDLNKDGKKELYLCVFRSCDGHMKIYRIS